MKTNRTHHPGRSIFIFLLLTAFTQCAVYAQIISSNNVALNKPATASSTASASFTASKAFDGDTATRFSSGTAGNEWIAVDLGQPYFINNVVLTWQTAYGKDFNMLFSINGTFTDLLQDSIQIRNNVLTGKTIAGINTIKTKSNTIARYVRMQGVHPATGNGYSLYEFQVSGAISAPGVLPVTLTGLTAVAQSNANILEWTTTTEYNNAGFLVEKSGDGAKFSTIGWVNAVNGGTVISHYAFTDKQLTTGRNYYRLKITDFAGASGYSLAVSINNSTDAGIKTYPVPVKDHIILEYRGIAGQNINIALFNACGKAVYYNQQIMQGSMQTMIINRTANMLPGSYILTIGSAGSQQYARQIILQ